MFFCCFIFSIIYAAISIKFVCVCCVCVCQKEPERRSGAFRSHPIPVYMLNYWNYCSGIADMQKICSDLAQKPCSSKDCSELSCMRVMHACAQRLHAWALQGAAKINSLSYCIWQIFKQPLRTFWWNFAVIFPVHIDIHYCQLMLFN